MEISKPLRVVHIIGKLCAGGVETFIFNYYKNIDKSMVQFDFVYDADSTVEPPQELIDMGARFYEVPPYQKLPQYLDALRRLFQKNGYQVVHSHLNTLSVFPLYVAFGEHIPVRIAHSHATAGKGEGKRNILKYILRIGANLFPNYRCACTSYAGNWLFGTGRKDIIIWKNAIDLNAFAYDESVRKNYRTKYGIGPDEIVIGHVGRFAPPKNQSFLLDIFKEIHCMNNNTKLVFVGNGKDEPIIRQKAEELGLIDSIVFTGIQKQVACYYQMFDAFVFPSFSEGLGIAAIEAQASGLPTVVSDTLPQDIMLTEGIQKVSLSAPASVWAQIVLDSIKTINRRSRLEDLRQNGYDITQIANDLACWYLDHVMRT